MATTTTARRVTTAAPGFLVDAAANAAALFCGFLDVPVC
jgi:hypothetical protein